MNMELTSALIDEYKAAIGRRVHVVMDRPIGTEHPKHPGVFYPINYGYIEGLLGGDGEEQDVYVLGEDKPVSTFDGVVIAVVHRYDDDECKWVAAKEGEYYSVEQIKNLIYFQERFHDSIVLIHNSQFAIVEYSNTPIVIANEVWQSTNISNKVAPCTDASN